MEWRDKFSNAVLVRGKTYFEEDKVTCLTEKNGSYTAFVKGNRGYSVYIGKRNGKITRMSCSCPFAAGRNKCKHMAAVLYAIEEEEAKKREQGDGEPEGVQETLQFTDNASSDEQGQVYHFFNKELIRASMNLLPAVERKGMQVIDEKRITLDSVEVGYLNATGELIVDARGTGMLGKQKFPVSILASRDKVEELVCGCPECNKYTYNYYGWKREKIKNCEYKAALLTLFGQYLDVHNIGDATDRIGDAILFTFQNRHANKVVANTVKKKDCLNILPKLVNKEGDLEVSFRIGNGKFFVVKDLDEFCMHIDNCDTVTYGSNTNFNHSLDHFTKNGQKYIQFIQEAVETENGYTRHLAVNHYYRAETRRVGNAVDLYGGRLDRLYDLLAGKEVDYEEGTGKKKIKKVLTCVKKNPEIVMHISGVEAEGRSGFHGITVRSRIPQLFWGTRTAYFVDGTNLCRIEESFMEQIQPLLQYQRDGEIRFDIGRNHLADFYYNILPEIRECVEIVDENEEEVENYLPPEAKFVFYLDAEDHNVTCKAHAVYGETEVSVLDIVRQRGDEATQELAMQFENFRNDGREEEICFLVSQWFPVRDLEEDIFHCGKDEERIYQVLAEGVGELLALGEVQSTDRFRHMNISRKMKVSIGVSVSNGLLDLDVSTDDLSREELLEVLKSYRMKKKFHRLKNGDFIDMEDNSFEALSNMMQAMHISAKDFVKGNMHIPAYRALYLDKMLEENDNIYSARDSYFRTMIKEFKTVSDADFEEPPTLKKTLRNYQRTGYKWLRTLEANHFGGILADDMGLGKTIQVIAVLLAAKNEKKKGTSIIVCPASLVFNWGEEIERFAPKLKTSLITGSQEERKSLIKEWNKYDVLVTSYDLLKRDILNYEDKTFTYEVIDEAQYIKNHTTEAAKAVKILSSEVRFALTGTPIENRLSELWSIFDYLMPGFLYSYEVFKREIETPIIKNEDEAAMDRLRKMVGPFILRRLKENVLKDLPDKLEEVRYAKFDEEQLKLYDAQIVHMKQKIESQDSSEFQKNKFQILAELMKLRQICCDPTLCFENYKGESAKKEACIDLVESAIEGGHKILLFSQFTSMLEILREEFEKRKISYYVITGATPKEKRLQMVKAFNQNDTQVFLISLKAGGTGLNLTGADVVIHYDPWWNLAVQNQATDRAHRIGQLKKVTVYQLIMKHSVEEKIQKIQETKRGLADNIINGETGQFSSLSKDEFLELLES